MEPTKVVSVVKDITSVVDKASVRVQASCPLQFVPWDVSCEEGLAEKVGGDVLAFAVQKVAEIVAVAHALPEISAGKQVRTRRGGVHLVENRRARVQMQTLLERLLFVFRCRCRRGLIATLVI